MKKFIIMVLGICALQNYATAKLGAIQYASTAVGSRYIFGGSTWDPKNRRYGGSDCAGLVLKAWKWPVAIGYRDQLRPSYVVRGKSVPGKLYTGTMLYPERYKLPWSKTKDLSKSSVGDALTYNSGGSGHTFLYVGKRNGMVRSLEARSRKHGIGYFERSLPSLKRTGYAVLKPKNFGGTSFQSRN